MLEVGYMVGLRYRLERQIGEGGSGSVWLATDTTLLRDVAIKFVWHRDSRRMKTVTSNFLREARLSASVVHQNVVQVLDVGLLDDQTPYMVMEALKGETLGDMFNDGALFSLSEVVQIFRYCLEGLSAVHRLGIVHRDLKPENIFLQQDATGFFPKLLDFGISRSLEPSTGLRSAVTTRDGRIVGTPEYMSPEQASGHAAVDRRSDVYSMGIIIYETVAGEVPYRTDNLAELLLQIREGCAPPLLHLYPEIGEPLSRVVQQAMEVDPAKRYADATEMLAAFEEAVENTCFPPEATPRDRVVARRHTQTQSTEDAMEADASAWTERQSRLPTASWTGAHWTPGPNKHLWATVAAGVSVALVAGLLIFQGIRSPVETNNFILVQGDAPSTLPHGTQITSSYLARVQNPLPLQRGDSGLPREAPKAVTSIRGRDANTEQAEAVGQAFAEQHSALAACFSTSDKPKEVAVRITVDEHGQVIGTSLTPAAYQRSALGSCVRQVVAKMRFAEQDGTKAFKVPLIARRGS